MPTPFELARARAIKTASSLAANLDQIEANWDKTQGISRQQFTALQSLAYSFFEDVALTKAFAVHPTGSQTLAGPGSSRALESVPPSAIDTTAEMIARTCYGKAPTAPHSKTWRQAKSEFIGTATGADRMARSRQFDLVNGSDPFFYDRPPFSFRRRQSSDITPALGQACADPSQVGYVVALAGRAVVEFFDGIASNTSTRSGEVSRTWGANGRTVTLLLRKRSPDDFRAVFVETDSSPLNVKHHDGEIARARDALSLPTFPEFWNALNGVAGIPGDATPNA